MPQFNFPDANFRRPEYQNGSILNLMASIIRSRGGESPHADLDVLSADRLQSYDRVIYLVIDGLGWHQLEHYLESAEPGNLAHFHREKITTVFPATTASAITSFVTGASPAEHAVLGWYLNLPDLGTSSTILFTENRTGCDLVDSEFDLRGYLAIPSHIESIDQHKRMISFGDIPISRFSRATTHWDSSISCANLQQLKTAIIDFSKLNRRGVAYVYWPHYDRLCHKHGSTNQLCVEHLGLIDQLLNGLPEIVAGENTALLITADHGIIDTVPGGHIDLMSIEGMSNCLSTLPCGDNGHAACFVRPRSVEKFLGLVDNNLTDRCSLLSGTDLLEQGLLGPGNPHPKLAGRVADFYLLAHEGFSFITPVPGQKTNYPVGYHGGMTAKEIEIPLIQVPG